MRLDEAGVWTDIERDAEEWESIADDLFWEQFGADPEAIPQRCHLIVNAQGVPVGTTSAWYRREWRGQEWGLVHWVAVRRAYQGLGMGKAGVAYTLQQLAQWHERALLGTESKRLRAIKMYLDFGFLPVLDEPDVLDAWREVKAALRHPVLERLVE